MTDQPDDLTRARELAAGRLAEVADSQDFYRYEAVIVEAMALLLRLVARVEAAERALEVTECRHRRGPCTCGAHQSAAMDQSGKSANVAAGKVVDLMEALKTSLDSARCPQREGGEG